jgi:protocatechuate 3,4-dioxygenase beta subunit
MAAKVNDTRGERSKNSSNGQSGGPARFFLQVALLLATVPPAPLRADDGKPVTSAPNSKAASGAAPSTTTFDLRIVDPDGKPVPDAKVNLSTQPPIDKVQVRAGKFLNKPRFGVNLLSDADGRVVVERPPHLEYLNFRIHKPGYGYYWSWSTKPETVLAPLTVKLERAWTIGGLVVDADGNPVPNARVLLQIRFAGTGQTGPADRLWTNSKGFWKFESVPESMTQVLAEISEPKFMMVNTTLSRAKFGIAPGHEPTGKTILKVGAVVTGKITDETGKPLAKALVRTRVGNDSRTAFTDKKGVYRLEGCDPGNVRIVVSAKGLASELRDVEVDPHLGPVDFQLKPGKTIRIRVLDEQGQPVSKAQIYFQRERGQSDFFEFDQAPRETDVDGVWEWTGAPADELMATISRPGGMMLTMRPVVARKDEYVFRVPSALVISGRVVDAGTKQVIKNFRVVRGYRWKGGQEQILWDNNKVTSTDGSFRMQETYEQSAYLVRIEADGYLHAVSREIKSDEGHVAIDFELLGGKEVAATILTPDGVPAAGAKVALLGGGAQVRIADGEIDNPGGAATIQEADEHGRFQIPTKNDDFWIVATHRSGYKDLGGLPSSSPYVIKLAPWARVEGTFQVARKPQADVELSISNVVFFAQNGPPLVVGSQTTDSHGRFVFDRVVPGRRRITSKRTTGQGDAEMTSSMSATVDCLAGKTTHVDLGVAGRPVIGQLRKPPDSKLDAPLSSAQIFVYVGQAGGAMQSDSLQFSATPDREGNFCIDIPPGNYFLNAFIRSVTGNGTQRRRFTVPTVNEKLSQRPVDLGVLMLEPLKMQPVRALKVRR